MTENIDNDKIIELIEKFFLFTYKDIFLDKLENEYFNEFERILENENFNNKYVLIDKNRDIDNKTKEYYYKLFIERIKKESDKSIKDKFIKYLLEIFFKIFPEDPKYNDSIFYNEIKKSYSQVGGKTRKSRKPRKQVRKSRKSKNPRKQVRKSRKSRKQVRKSRKSRKQVRRNRK